MATPERRDGIVTPEAVLLQFETASVSSRTLARFLDLMAQFTALMIIMQGLGMASLPLAGSEIGSVIVVIAYLVASFAVLIAYPIVMETRCSGRTLGKMAMGLRVVTREGGPVRFRHATIRGLIGLAEVFALPFIAVSVTAVSRDNQRVGDFAAGTIVLRERRAGSQSMAVSFPPPPGMETFVRTLDVSAMTAEQYHLVRSFLMRAFKLSSEARLHLGSRLANPLSAVLRHDLRGLGPELYLLCVASAYQVRHGAPTPWTAGPTSWGPPPGWRPPPPGQPPVPAYGAPAGYGAPQYGAAAGYGAPSGYGAPQYGAPSGYGPPPPGWRPPPPVANPAPAYGVSTGSGHPPAGYGAPPPGWPPPHAR